MKFEHVKYEEREGVAVITLNRPELLNALTFEIYAELRDRLTELSPIRSRLRAIRTCRKASSRCSGPAGVSREAWQISRFSRFS